MKRGKHIKEVLKQNIQICMNNRLSLNPEYELVQQSLLAHEKTLNQPSLETSGGVLSVSLL